MQTQPDHIEVVAEKLTVESILKEVTRKYRLPLLITRGRASVTARQKLFERFDTSGKERIILLMVSDLDPAGDEIAKDTLLYLRRDCGVSAEQRTAYRVALTRAQVEEFNLPPKMLAKATDTNTPKFTSKHGTSSIFELEALRPADLAMLLERAIRQVINIPLYEQELKLQKADRKQIEAKRQRLMEVIDEDE